MSATARLMLRHDPSKVAPLDPASPLTIGRAAGNRLRLPSTDGVAANHAVVRHSSRHGWIVCDWESGSAGTWLEGERVERCRPLHDGATIQLGVEGPVLVFQLLAPATAGGAIPEPFNASASASASASRPASVQPQPPAPAEHSQARSITAGPRPASPPAASTISLGPRRLPLDRIVSAEVRSRPRHPHSFSWWLLVCLGGLVLLPWPWLFWPLEALALAGWILLGAQREHVLLVTLRDGMAHRHSFASRTTALSHRNGVRQAIGQGDREP